MSLFYQLSFLLFVFLATSCSYEKARPIELIPEPLSIMQEEVGSFMLKGTSEIFIEDSSMFSAAEHLQRILGNEHAIQLSSSNDFRDYSIVLTYDGALDSLTHEGYVLDVNKNQILIRSSAPNGLFYAAETIRQLLPNRKEDIRSSTVAIPVVTIVDAPRFAWRGMHLDVSRHFMPLEFVKKFIDYLALHKLNVFHWHLTDGIGWRIEIASHPELTDIGGWRKVKEGKRPWQDFEVWREGDNEPKYGGFYTQDEIREVVAYAQERFINVLPEIELPGHSEVVMQCYPQLLCTNARGESLHNSGVFCAANAGSYKLLEDVIDEVIELFPSEYIHIGGDEVAKENWNSCVKCKQMMRTNGYDAHQLQSHFVNHFDSYLKEKGRKLMGWHEILEGELSPTASIMYWGAHDETAEALKQGHLTVLTPGSHFYFDHYQSLSSHEPKAFGGFSSLKKVFDLEPVPAQLEKAYRDNVLGVQANLWTEYMDSPKHVEYMMFPRVAALAEVAWSSKENKSWTKFQNKMNALLSIYDAMGVNYAFSALRPAINFELDEATKQLKVDLNTELHTDIYYTLDGSEPNLGTSQLYAEPFYLGQSATVKAIAFKNGVATGISELKEARLHKAVGSKVDLISSPQERYAARGGATLVDADFGEDKWGNGKWLGFLNKDFEAKITFDEVLSIENVALSFIEETGSGIYFPKSIEVSISSDDENYQSVGRWKSLRSSGVPISPDVLTDEIKVSFNPIECKYIKIKAAHYNEEEQGVFIFIDEILVE